jgi:hypothetical protein
MELDTRRYRKVGGFLVAEHRKRGDVFRLMSAPLQLPSFTAAGLYCADTAAAYLAVASMTRAAVENTANRHGIREIPNVDT